MIDVAVNGPQGRTYGESSGFGLGNGIFRHERFAA